MADLSVDAQSSFREESDEVAETMSSQPTEPHLSSPPRADQPMLPATQPALPPPETPETSRESSAQPRPPRQAFSQPAKHSSPIRAPPAPPTPRLVIQQLVLTNFKSYAGKQVVGPFHSSFSAVVGPNGSGKSNVIDSLLFVFGFRASKMRQSKLSELIHNSEQFRNLGFCRVDVHFKKVVDTVDESGHDMTEDVPDSELVVSRKAMRNNSSQYYVNNHGSSYTEVRNLLLDQGIDLDHKRFLILQGEVESIAQMKPKGEKDSDDGLLEYLEDIIGTSKYKEGIGKRLEKIDELNDVCTEKERRFAVVDKSKREMEQPKDSALAFLADEKSYFDKKAVYLQLSLQNDKKSLEENKRLLEETEAKLVAVREESGEVKKKAAGLHVKIKQLTQETQKLDKEIAVQRAQHKKVERQKVTMDEKMKHMQGRQKKAAKALEEHRLALREAEAALALSEQNVQDYKQQEEQLSAELAEQRSLLEQIQLQLSDKTKALSQQMEKLQTELQPWQRKIDAKSGELDVKRSELEILQRKLAEMGQSEAALSQSVEEKTASIAARRSEIELLKKEKEHVTSQIKLGEPEVASDSQKLREMERQLSEARQRAEDAKSRISSNESRNRVLSALQHLKDTGRLEGFHGRLGDLGVIDDKYDVAVSTGGGSLDDMVVDSVECAQQCIAYIRENRLGFGKFIVLDKLRKFNLARIPTPDNTPRLFDLIEPAAAKYAPAFYSSMYNTLVARDLATANRVAFGGNRRWRVVTLDGKLVDSSGTMSGGGGSVYRGGMKLRSKHPGGAGGEVSPEQLQGLMDDARKKEEAFSKASQVLKTMQEALAGFKERLPQIDVEVSKKGIAMQSLNEEATSARTRLRGLQKENAVDKVKVERDIAAIEKVVKKLEQEKKELESQCSGLQAQIEQLEQKIMDVGGVKLKVQKAKVDSVVQKLEILGDKKSNEGVAISKAKNKISRLEKQIGSNEEEIAQCTADIAAIEADYTAKVQQFEVSEKKVRELQSLKDDKSDEKESLDEQVEQIESETTDLRRKETKMAGELEKYQVAVSSFEKHMSQVTHNAGSFQFRDTSVLLTWMEPEECKQYMQTADSLPQLSDEELAQLDAGELKEEVARMKSALDSAEVDLAVLEEYSKRHAEFQERKADLDESVTARNNEKEQCEQMKKKRHDEFMAGFESISSTLREMYHMITMGGNAELELVDSLDPFSEGILFSVMPPRKSWKNISNLSGGEKTLSSLALVFALHSYKPTPLYVMDEIDAALDFRNVSIVANYIKGRTKNAQFVVISLRNNMFELAANLVGIYKVSNMTKSVTLENREMLK